MDLFRIRPVRADLRLLGDVSLAFSALPWENLTKFLKKHRGDLDPAARLRRSEEVLRDHAEFGAGGTCFSLTNALRRIVADLGYDAFPAMADMRHGRNIHCALLVVLDGERYLLDPGYLVPEPVPLKPGKGARLTLPGRTLEYRPVEGCDEFELYTGNDRGETLRRYRLRPRTVPESDFHRHWIRSFDLPGMNGLHLNRIAGKARISAHDYNLRIDTGREKANEKLREGYVAKVSSRFGLDGGLVRSALSEWERIRCREE
jgi:arylamine N-acetyltransferase